MKKVIAVLLVMGMLCLVAGCSSTSAEPTASADAGEAAASSTEEAAASSDEVYRIGIACPLTGTSATYGEIMLAGAQIAVDEINAEGGINGRKIELVSMDDKNDPSEAALVAQRFCDMEDIQMVIAHGSSSVTLAAAPIYEAAQMPFMSPASSSPDLTEQGYEYYVRFGVRDDRVAPQIIAFLANNLGIKKIGVIFANNDYGRGNLDAAASAAEQSSARQRSRRVIIPERRRFARSMAGSAAVRTVWLRSRTTGASPEPEEIMTASFETRAETISGKAAACADSPRSSTR